MKNPYKYRPGRLLSDPIRSERNPLGRYYIIAVRGGQRSVLTSCTTRQDANQAANTFRQGGIEAEIVIEVGR